MPFYCEIESSYFVVFASDGSGGGRMVVVVVMSVCGVYVSMHLCVCVFVFVCLCMCLCMYVCFFPCCFDGLTLLISWVFMCVVRLIGLEFSL